MKHVPSIKGLAFFGVVMVALIHMGAARGASFDVQVNNPPIAGDPSSYSTARFPTNKQNEPTIAVNPINSHYLIAAANDRQVEPPCGPGPARGTVPRNDCSLFPGIDTSGLYVSSTGGATWINIGVPNEQSGWFGSDVLADGDPVIVYGPKPDGRGDFSYATGARAYYATLASYKPGRSPFPPQKTPELVVVSFSDDNGATWSAPTVAFAKENPTNLSDKPDIWADNNPDSPFFGRLFVTWTQFRSAQINSFPSEPIVLTFSTDGGLSFTAGKQLSPAGPAGDRTNGNGRQGPAVRSGPDGSVYVAWAQEGVQVVAISRDGGDKWSRPITIGSVAPIADPIPGANFRTNSLPSLAADPRARSSTLYAAWVDGAPDGGRVVVSTSKDKGVSWSGLESVSTAAEGYAFFQALNVAPNGRVDLGYQALGVLGSASTFGPGNAEIDSWFVSKPASGSWSVPLKVTSAVSDPSASSQSDLVRQFWGDYNTLASDTAHVWFIYTDSRNGAGCLAVTQYQQGLAAKPAPEDDCPAQFGNTDVYVSVITP